VISRIHRQLGTAGFVISIIALIAALGGGAYAASGGFSAKQKKEIRKIAEGVATPGPQGPAGTAGSQGTPGSPGIKGDKGDRGENGTNGTNGANGTNGTDGENVAIIPLAAANGTGHCEQGGAKFTNGTGEAFACNGGASGGYPETLPSGHTETGFWEVQGGKGISNEFASVTTISFPLKLGTAPTEKVLITESSSAQDKAKCPGEAFEPKATPGVLCLYVATAFSGSVTLKLGGIQPFGATLFFAPTDEAWGSWAVKAA
jgi:hypothetical protein